MSIIAKIQNKLCLAFDNLEHLSQNLYISSKRYEILHITHNLKMNH